MRPNRMYHIKPFHLCALYWFYYHIIYTYTKSRAIPVLRPQGLHGRLQGEHCLYFYGDIFFLYVPTFEGKMLLEDQLGPTRLLGIIFQQRRVLPVIIVRISRVVLWHVCVGTGGRLQCSFDPFTTQHQKKMGVQTPCTSRFARDKNPLSILQKTGWASEPVWGSEICRSHLNRTIQPIAIRYTDGNIPGTVRTLSRLFEFFRP